MKTGVFALLCVLAIARAASPLDQAEASPNATLFRVFLKDGGALVSYGEVARVENRVIFSMPLITTAVGDPPLQLVNLPFDLVDWVRTTRYADSARALHYLSTRAMADYVQLSNEVAETLNQVARTPDTATRLAIVERARMKLAEWPAAHYDFNRAEVQGLLLFLDEAIADLRASTGIARFNLNLVATGAPLPPLEAMLPPPTLQELIEQVLVAARLADSPSERASLLSAALASLERGSTTLPAEWVSVTTATVRSEIADEIQIDRQYQLLTQTMLFQAGKLARTADVRGIQRTLAEISGKDQLFGEKRPDVVQALVASVQAQLDAARKLQLERDHWALRVPVFRRYRTSLASTFEAFTALKPSLEDIRALAGSTPTTLASIERLSGQILQTASHIKPPDELQPAHALLVSAAQLAKSAASIRRDAIESADLTKAWDASSAAAGALMLSARAQTQIQMLLRVPQPPQ